jgi:hypothetical protein
MEWGTWWKHGSDLYLDATVSMIKCALIGFLIFECFSCSNSKVIIERGDLVGLFIADAGKFRDSIETSDDGTYIHTYRFRSSDPEVQSRGTWKTEIREGSVWMIFSDFVWGTEFQAPNLSDTERAMPSFWIVPVEKSGHKIRLRIHPDFAAYYVKN